MDRATIKATHESIDHWFDVLERKSYHTGAETCALCVKFKIYTTSFNSCRLCPVKQKTGFSSCTGSPYQDYVNQPTRANARKEINFLISLLPEKEQECYWYD